jgi:ATP-dependent DNA helicase RecG
LILHGAMQDPAFILFISKLETEHGARFSSHQYLVLDLVRRGEPIPKENRVVLQSLKEAGLIETHGHGRGTRYELSPQYYHAQGKPRPIDRDTEKIVLSQFIEEHRSRGSTLAEMLAEFPSVSRDQLKGLLKELKGEGKVHGVGRTRGGRWYPGTTSR